MKLKSSSKSWGRVFLELGAGIIASGVFILTVLLIVLLAPPLDGMRRDIAERLLTAQIGQDVRLQGPLRFSISPEFSVSLSDLLVKNPNWASSPNMLHVRKAEIAVRLWPLLSGVVVVPRLLVDGATLHFETASDGRKTWQQDIGKVASQITKTAETPFNLPLFDIVSLNKIAIKWLDKLGGFNNELSLERLQTKRAANSAFNTVDGLGRLNGVPIALTGRLSLLEESLSSNSPLVAQMALKTEGFQVALDGKIQEPKRGRGVHIVLTSKVSSIGDVLAALEIERVLEGNAELSAQITGGNDKLSVSRLQAKGQFDTGDKIGFSGSVADLRNGKGINIEFSAKLLSTQAPEGSDSLFDRFRLTGFSGKISGDLEALSIRDLHIDTNAYARDVNLIGPITIKTLQKDEKNRLQLLGIEALAGPPGKPNVRLQGSIGDLLRLKKISLQGTFDVDVAPILGFEGDVARGRLGRLKGELQVSDADGSAGLEKFNATVADSDLLSLKIVSVLDDFKRGDDLKLDVSLRVPNYSAFAKAVGLEPHNIGAIAFEGRMAGSDELVNVNGEARVGQTTISGRLAGTLKGKRPSLRGDLSSPQLRLSDLRVLALPAKAVEIPKGAAARQKKKAQQPSRKSDPVTHSIVSTLGAVDLDLKIKVGKIVGSQTQLSNIAGHVKLVDRLLNIESLHVLYLGGKLRLAGTMDARKRPTKFQIKGRADDWRLGSFLKASGTKPLASGEMYARLSLSGTGETWRAIRGSLNGQFGLAVARGRIESDLISLAGLDLSGYLFSRAAQRGYTPVNCFIGRFALKNGVATATTLLLDTPDILMKGKGAINLRRETVNIRVTPRPKQRKIVELGTPFTISGSLSNPKLTTHGTALRVVGEVLLWDINLLGSLLGLVVDSGKDGGNPCLGRRARRTPKKK